MTGLWNNEDKKKLFYAALPIFEEAKAYGRIFDLKLILQGWQARFQGEYDVDHIIYALQTHADKSSEIPTRSDIIKILNPEKPKIPVGVYLQAKKDYAASGYNKFTHEYDIIKNYEEQEKESKQEYLQIDERLREMIPDNMLKSIEDKSEAQ